LDENSKFTIIKNKELKNAIVISLADDITRRILDSTISQSKTVDEIIAEKKFLILLHIAKLNGCSRNSYYLLKKSKKIKKRNQDFYLQGLLA